MSIMSCGNPYEPTFLACVGLDLPERWYPYGPGLPVRWEPAPAVSAPFVLTLPDAPDVVDVPSLEDEWAVAARVVTASPYADVSPAPVPEPAAALLLLLACVASVWKVRRC